MGNLKLIRSSAATNLATNPEFFFNITDYWTSITGTAATLEHLVNELAYIGPGFFKLTSGTTLSRLRSSQTTVADGETFRAQCLCFGVGNTNGRLLLFDVTNTTERDNADLTAAGEWELLEVEWTNSTGSPANVRIDLREVSANAGDVIRFDAVVETIDAEIGEYFDGDTDGCYWSGWPHESASIRPLSCRSSGEVVDIETEYNVSITQMTGWGALTPKVDFIGLPDLPGTTTTKIVDTDRALTPIVRTTSGTLTATHGDAHDLIEDLAASSNPNPLQPLTLKYTGWDDADLYIDAHFWGDMSGSLGRGFIQKYALQMHSDHPYWRRAQSAGGELDTNDAVTFRYSAHRDADTGQWDALGLTADPTTNGTIYKVLRARDGLVYYFGDFTELDGVAGRDYAAIYDPITETWSDMDGDNAFDDVIYDACEGPDGTIYMVGLFTNAGGDADADNVAEYDPATDTVSAFSSSGSPGGGCVACAFYDGELYASYNGTVYKSSGVAWTDLSATDFTAINALIFDEEGTLYAGGYDSTLPTDTTLLRSYDGSSWTALVSGDAGAVRSLQYHNGSLYVGGTFLELDGVTCNGICIYDPDSAYVQPFGGGLVSAARTGAILDIQIAPDGRLWAAGYVTTSKTIINGISRWTGGASPNGVWKRADAYFGSDSITVNSIAFGKPDPNALNVYDIYIGSDTSAAGSSCGDATIDNTGTAPAWPRMMIKRTGGSGATLHTLRNTRTGAELLFQYKLEDGEYLIIDCRPKMQTITSSYYGLKQEALLSGSSLAGFTLLPGDNVITCFAAETGSPTITASLWFYPEYKGA